MLNKFSVRYLIPRRLKDLLIAASFSTTTAYCQDIYTDIHRQAEAIYGNQARATVLSEGIPLAIWELHTSDKFREIFIELLDHSIEANWITGHRAMRISSTYRDLFSESKWGRRAFTKDEDSNFQRFRELLFTQDLASPSGYRPSPGYIQYSTFLKDYKKLRDEYDKTPPGDRTAAMFAKLNEAKQKLANQGQQALYREAESRLKSLLTKDYSLSVFPKLRKNFEQNLLPNGELRVDVTPKMSPLMNLFSWKTSVVKPTNDTIASPVFGYTPTGVNAGLGIYSPTGEVLQKLDLPPGLTITFEMARIEIIRPWLDSEALSQSSGLWTWKDSSHAKLSETTLSENNLAPLTFIPISLIATRNIRLEANWSNTAIIAISQAILSGNTVRLGPFILATPATNKIPHVIPSFINEKTMFIGVLQILGTLVSQQPNLPASVASASIVFDSPLPDLPFLQ